ncbi:GIN domain-containing protein [Aquimarina pacifica]|uniref:GIN domain-containing protein n=1 Tax=Aquimarina pacifica TaxID=1296415 RepID=UPI00046E56B1|nr:DUF2807 domain-containing protein [Aquimarina pacifica]
MRTSLIVLLSFFAFGNIYSQKEKVKGNKIISTEDFDTEGFHTIELQEGFDVTFDQSNLNQVTIEADSNILREIDVIVQDSILTITSEKDLKRAKELNIQILYASELKKIILSNKVNAKSLTPIHTNEFTLEMYDNTETFLTVEATKIQYIGNDKASCDLHVKAKEITYQINDNSELKGIIAADSLTVDLYQKASAKLEGQSTSMLVRADNDTDFFGEKLSTKQAKLVAEGTSDCYLLISEQIKIEARDKAEIFLLGQPKISIDSFENEATLYKKKDNYSPGFF